MFPLIIYTLLIFNKKEILPEGAIKEISGHISLYEDTFWYTDGSHKHTFDFSDYNIDDSYKKGEIINIYLDKDNNVLEISHKKENYTLYISVILMYIVPIILLITHAILGRKTYGKNWYLYAEWYRKEIKNNKDINKKYYKVIKEFKELSEEDKVLYKKYRNKSIIYSVLLLICIILTIYFCNKYNLNPYSLLILIIIIIYSVVFYLLINNCENKMREIKLK